MLVTTQSKPWPRRPQQQLPRRCVRDDLCRLHFIDTIWLVEKALGRKDSEGALRHFKSGTTLMGQTAIRNYRRALTNMIADLGEKQVLEIIQCEAYRLTVVRRMKRLDDGLDLGLSADIVMKKFITIAGRFAKLEEGIGLPLTEDEAAADLTEGHMAQEEIRTLVRCTDLTERELAVTQLKFCGQFTAQEISLELAISEPRVKQVLKQALTKLACTARAFGWA